MRKSYFVIALVGLLGTTSSYAETVKDGGYVGCVSDKALSQFIRAVRTKDEAATNHMLTKPECVFLNSNMRITVLDRSLGTAQIRVYVDDSAVDLWTVSEAIQR